MLTVLVDHGSANLHSAAKAFARVAAETDAGRIVVSADPEVVARADRIVLPGDGAFAACRRQILAHAGLMDALEEAVRHKGRPCFGICLGMQLLASRGFEFGETPGLDWIPGEVVRIAPLDSALKVPHMGWNELTLDRPHPALAGVQSGDHAYFVHSYHFRPADPAHLVAHTDYGGPLAAIVGRDNVLGTQFHPEKSQRTGLAIIAGFLRWKP